MARGGGGGGSEFQVMGMIKKRIFWGLKFSILVKLFEHPKAAHSFPLLLEEAEELFWLVLGSSICFQKTRNDALFTINFYQKATRVNPSLAIVFARLLFQYGAGNCKKDSSWFARDVTKILKSKPGGLQNFYLLLMKDYLKIYLFTIP